MLSIAKLRLHDLLEGEQQRISRQKEVESGKMTFADAIEAYKREIENNVESKPRTRKYKQEIIIALGKCCANLASLDMKKITETDCQDWRSEFAKNYSATRINGAVSAMRRVFQIAVEAGVRHGNPMQIVRRARVRKKELRLPENEKFHAFVAEIKNGRSRFSNSCADLVQFLAYGGFRISEAARVVWADCDFSRKRITVRGDPTTRTKNGEIREIPMISDMQQLLGKLREVRPNDGPHMPVMLVRECQKAMDRAARKVGMSRITHHDLRHLFATRAIESGVDIPTVSKWLGHKDGGALAMRVYGHLRDLHSDEMARKVRFTSAEPANPSQQEKTGVEDNSPSPV